MAQILRYPYEALTDETDYLQIDIVGYTPVGQLSGGSLVSGESKRRISSIVNTKGATPQTTRLKSGVGTILLPIPSNVQDGNSVSFAEGQLDGLTAQIYGAAKNAMTEFQFSANPLKFAEEVSSTLQGLSAPFVNNADSFKNIFLAQLASAAANIPLGGSLTRDAVFARQSGEILNQNVELLFNGVNLRSFKFSFKLTPRSSDEAKQVKFIINAFKKNMAPKLGGKSATGRDEAVVSNIFLNTPNVFNLTYKKGNDPHPFLHKFKQCALTDMSVNYTGEGVYATYGGANKDGGGTPVSMVLELGFKELEPIYNTDYNIDDDDQLTRGVGY